MLSSNYFTKCNKEPVLHTPQNEKKITHALNACMNVYLFIINLYNDSH